MKVVIMRGIPGSGKSTYVARNFPLATVCSADHFFLDKEGNYKFDPKRIGEAHLSCQKKFARNLMLGYCLDDEDKVLVVDNTNTSLWEMAFYIGLCNVYGIPFEIHRMNTPADVCAERNVHGVPPDKVHLMAKRMEKVPPHIGKEILISGLEE